MISPLPGSRALGAGFLHMAPPGATRRALGARLCRRCGNPTPRIARLYATIRDTDFQREVEQQVFQQEVFDREMQTVSDYMGSELSGRYLDDDGADAGVDTWGDTSGSPLLREIRDLKYMLFRKYEVDELPATMDFVGWLLEAVRVGDSWRAYLLLMDVAWENDLMRLYDMPPTQIAELFECLDPLRVHERVDVLANLRFSPAMRGYGFADHLIDKYGVRRIYGTALDILGPIIEDRVRAKKHATPPAVFSTLFRLAGAASLPRLAYRIRELAGEASELWSDKKLDAFSSGDMMLDYLRTMFLTESVYYQHDKSRVRVRPRNMPHSASKLRYQQRHRLEALNMHARQIKSHSFGLDPDDKLQELQRWVGNHRRMQLALPISRLHVCGPSEDIACAALVASAASGTSEVIKRLLFMFWGVKVTASGVKGGEKIDPDSAMRPTEKALKAVARALGGSNEISMAIRVISHMSSHFGIPVPREVWSELLEFAHVHGAHPASEEWLYADLGRHIYTKNEIPALMNVLEKKQGFTLDFRDYVVLATNLIGAGELPKALRPLREAKALYEEVRVKAETAAVAAAAAQAQKVAMPSYVSRDLAFRHLTMEREVKRHELMTACREWLRQAGRERFQGVEGRPFARMIPNFVLEFFDLVPQRIEYDTPTGSIMFHHPVQRVMLSKEWAAAPDVQRDESARVLLSELDNPEDYREYYGGRQEEVDEEEAAFGEMVDEAANADAGEGGVWAGGVGAADRDARASEDVEDVISRITGTDAQGMAGETNAESTAAAGTESAGAGSTGAPDQTEDETYVDKLIARKAGDAADFDHILAQNMGGAWADEPSTDSQIRENTAQGPKRSERQMTDEERREADYQARMNEGRGTVWEWEPEQVVVRAHGWVNVRTPVPRARLGPEGRKKWEVEGRAVFAEGGAVRVEEPWRPGRTVALEGPGGKPALEEPEEVEVEVEGEKKVGMVEGGESEERRAFEKGDGEPTVEEAEKVVKEGEPDKWEASEKGDGEPAVEEGEKVGKEGESEEWKAFEKGVGEPAVEEGEKEVAEGEKKGGIMEGPESDEGRAFAHGPRK